MNQHNKLLNLMKNVKLSHKNKISDSIAKFSNINIVGYLDFNFNKRTNNSLNEFTLPYNTIIWTKEILENRDEICLWKKSIINYIEKGKNIYNMARLYRISDFNNLKSLANENNVLYFDCSNPNKFNELKKYSLLDNLKKPIIITIMGTGMRSGKFTTTMILKRELKKYNYNISVVGTEPQSLLCGANEMVIPQLLPLHTVAPTIQGAINKLIVENTQNINDNSNSNNNNNNNSDIILISSQTGIYSNPLEVNTGRGGGVVSLALLLGSNPDYIILAAHTLDYKKIIKNINVIELLTNKKVIGITLNCKNSNISNDELKNEINKLSNKINIPIADLVKGINKKEFIKQILEIIY